MAEQVESLPERVLVLAPTGRDGELASGLLQREGLTTRCCTGTAELLECLEAGAGTAVVADEALSSVNIGSLLGWLQKQPPWSDFPFIVLTAGGRHSYAPGRMELWNSLGKVTLLERPLHAVTLLSAVRAGLRGRRRQYDAERYIAEVQGTERRRAEAYAREQAVLAQLELLSHLGKLLAAEPDIDKLLQSVVETGAKVSGAEFGIFLPSADVMGDRPEMKLPHVYAMGLDVSKMMDAISVLAGTVAKARLVRGVLRVGDTRTDHRFDPERRLEDLAEGPLAFVSCLALQIPSRTYANSGVLIFGHSMADAFTEREEDVACALAAQAGIAIDNARLFSISTRARETAEKARDDLQRSNDDLQQFIYVASHDLKEPLRTIGSYTQLLARRYRGNLGPDADEFIDYVVRGVNKMSGLIQDLLEYTRAGAAITGPVEPIDAQVALDDALSTLRAAIEESAAAVTSHTLPQVAVDQRLLAQVFQNLIANAIKYRRPGTPRIHISAESRSGEWIFAVEDNGIGIDALYHQQIFGLFKRLHGPDVPGTGIGLAICRRIIERFGGRIWVESTTDQGSTFRFALPKCANGAVVESDCLLEQN